VVAGVAPAGTSTTAAAFPFTGTNGDVPLGGLGVPGGYGAPSGAAPSDNAAADEATDTGESGAPATLSEGLRVGEIVGSDPPAGSSGSTAPGTEATPERLTATRPR
jgi:hypothetical protein